MLRVLYFFVFNTQNSPARGRW